MSEVPVNVCVAVRVRPLLPSERLHSHQVCVKKVPNSKNQLLVGKDRAFTFDHLLWWNTSQQDVYRTTVKPLVETCFQGYNATVFAYGQTGSGKTHTIGGSNPGNMTKDEQGIIPRAVDDIFSQIKLPGRKHIDHIIKVSYVEIYKEELRDLLEVDIQKCKDVHIREDQNGKTFILGAREEQCTTAEEVLSLLQKGSAVRHTGATQMNELSSRSHAIFTIHMVQAWPCTPRPTNTNESNNVNGVAESKDSSDEHLQNVMSAKFHFVDLAGSERANRTGNTGERLKESVQINTGLLALGNVISALGDPKKKKAVHIPYRDSKITRVLKDSLGGNARTVMITCISPSSTSFDETLNALKYANRAKNITNKPVVNRDPQQVLIEEMQDEIEVLKQQLQERPTTREIAMHKQKMLEVEVEELQIHCKLYKKHIDEAAKHFKSVCAGKHVTKTHSVNIKKWLESVSKNGLAHSKQSIISSFSTTISRDDLIRQELEECKKNLASDDAVFKAKDTEMNEMRKMLEELQEDVQEKQDSVQLLDDIREQQCGKLIEQNVIIEQLREEILFMREEFHHLQHPPASSSRPPGIVSVGRAQSVPHPARGLTFSGESRISEEAKRAHSSPPLISAERIMAGFRARNHVIVDRIEEEDEVDHRSFVADDNDPGDSLHGRAEAGDRSDRSAGSRKIERNYTPQQQWRIPSSRKNPPVDVQEKAVETELNILRESTLLSVRRLKDSELRAQNSNNKIRELSINIRMKEELIKDLVRTGNDAEAVKRDYMNRIQILESEVQAAKRDLLDAHKSLQVQPSGNKPDDQEQQKLKVEYEQKLKDAKAKVQMLQKKQRETEKIATIPTQNKKKVKELEIGISSMRQMQEDLQKKLKNEQDKKRRLETEMNKDQARLKDLEEKTKNQEKVLKRKTEEVVAIQRKLRSAKNGTYEEPEDFDEQRKWLDSEVEKALEQQRLLKQLEEALRAREAAVKRREEAMSRKTALETKKMRSSQVISTEALQLASKMASVDNELSVRSQQLRESMTSDRGSARQHTHQHQLKKAIDRLVSEKQLLEEKRKRLEEKLQDGNVLNMQDERELIELDEAVEALSAAIEWQDDTILRTSTSSDLRERRMRLKRERSSGLQKHLKNLSGTEAGLLLTKCFERVIELRESEHLLEGRLNEMELRITDRDRTVVEAETALNRFAVESDRRLMEMEKQHEQRTQQLIKQLGDRESLTGIPTSNQDVSELQNKISVMEKDLSHYKSTNRELKRKLREIVLEVGGENLPLSARSTRSNSDSEPGKMNSGRKDKFEGPTQDSGAVLNSNSTTSSILGPLSKHPVGHHPSGSNHGLTPVKSQEGLRASEDKRGHSSPHKQKRGVKRQMSSDATPTKEGLTRQQGPDSTSLPPNLIKMGSNPNLMGSANLRRTRNDSHSLHPSISSNSVEYLEYQDLNQHPRGGSGGLRQISPNHPLEGSISTSHPPGNPPNSHGLITASLSKGDTIGLGHTASKMYPHIHPSTYGDELGEGPSKPGKLDPTVTPVRISKKDLKPLAKNEITQRKTSLSSINDTSASGARQSSLGPTLPSNPEVGLVQDSLEGFRNPWS